MQSREPILRCTQQPLPSSDASKILIDYLRNNRTNTSVCAYSPRARPGAMVSMPLDWSDLSAPPERWTLTAAPRRLKRLRDDPWAEYWTSAQGIADASFAGVQAL
jgi:bifunctional non-homologous end joining protein LigD